MNGAFNAFVHNGLRFLLKAASIGFKIALWMVPTAGAFAALIGLSLWVLGLGAFSGAGDYASWFLGLLVLAAYLCVYGVYVGGALVGWFAKRPGLSYGAAAFVWICLIVAAAVMQHLWADLAGGQ